MKHSILWKLVLIILPLVLLSDFAVLCVTYQITYESTLNHCREDVKNAAKMADEFFQMFDPYDPKSMAACSETFDELCKELDMMYIYAEMPDVENDTFEYLSIGFGEKASEKARSERYAGYVGKGIRREKIDALEKNETVFCSEENEFGNVIVCYVPVDRYVDSDYHTYTTDKPVIVIGAEMSIEEVIRAFKTAFLFNAIAIVAVTVMIVCVIAVIIRWKVAKPARLLSRRMVDFVSDREKEFEPIRIKGRDEFAGMADSFNSMALEIDRYIEDISQLNREKTTQEAELNIARTIQLGLLQPNEFRSKDAEIDAYMLPAKNVGGDLYDYLALKNGRICVTVADVSGKGVSAALFMSRAITLLHQYAEAGLSPGEIMYRYNNSLAAQNPNTMFITTFVGIYDPATHELVYSNAGHNTPYVLSDSLIPLKGTGSMAAGIFEDETYPERTLVLKPGDTLFLYTDGVTEAKNTENRLFGDIMLERTLYQKSGASGKEVLDEVLSRVREFSDGAEQSDDITVLTLTVPKDGCIRLRLAAKSENLSGIIKAIDSLGISGNDKKQLRLIAEEMFVNICSYAYEDGGEVQIEICAGDGKATLTFCDSGRPFDPTKDVIEIDDYDIDHSIGGLGRFLTFMIADSYAYEYRDGKNILRITKNLEEDQ